MQISTMRSRRSKQAVKTPLSRCALAAGLLLADSHAQAHTFCVTNGTDLRNALTDASNGGMYNGEDNDIQLYVSIAPGQYSTGSGPFHYVSSAASGRLTLTGGYLNGTCSAHTTNPLNTVLDGNHATQVLSLRSTNAPIVVTGLTIQNGESAQDGGGLTINYVLGDDSAVTVIDNIVQNNHTTGAGGGMFVASGGTGHALYVQNNLIVGNSADTGNGAAEVIANGSFGGIYNNTVVQNTTTASGAAGGFYYGGGVSGHIVNNIFFNNANFGLYLGTTDVYLDYNDYGTLGGLAPNESSGNVSVNPKFVDSAGGDFHLTSASPLLGISPIVFAGFFDPDGNKSPAGGKTDLGAYFETTFTDGFDGN